MQRGTDRYYVDHGWLKTHHSFSFAHYYDPQNLNWGALRVLNEDRIAPGRGFDTHPHENMEIITYVLSGELEHKDSLGNTGIVGAGSVQFMSAGTGVAHAENNHSKHEELHLVQMWVLPGQSGLPPRYGQADFTTEQRSNRWLAVASGRPDVSAPIKLSQDAAFYVARLQDTELAHRFQPGRLAFLFVAQGSLEANGGRLGAGDALRIADLEELKLKGEAEVLFWDVPRLEKS